MAKDLLPPFDESGSRKSDPHSPGPPEDDGRGACVPDEIISPFGEPWELPITDVLDLHTVSPRDAQAVVKEYLQECYRLKLTAIRIVHGRGIGAQRAMVRKLLEENDFVVSFGDAPLEAGGWGATVATLRVGGPEEN